MPAKSEAQKRLMDAAAHNPAFAKKVGIPSKVAKDFSEASIGMKFKKGGAESEAARQSVNSPKTNHGEQSLFSKGGKTMDKEDIKQDKALIKKAFKQHDAQEHKGGKGTTLSLKKGGSFRASANGIAQRGKTKGTMVAMCGGGMAKKK